MKARTPAPAPIFAGSWIADQERPITARIWRLAHGAVAATVMVHGELREIVEGHAMDDLLACLTSAHGPGRLHGPELL